MINPFRPTEKDIENAFVSAMNNAWLEIYQQVEFPSGIADVVGIYKSENKNDSMPIMVAEIKRDRIDRNACGQLFGYLYQMQSLIETKAFKELGAIKLHDGELPPLIGVLIGSSIEEKARRIIDVFHLSGVPVFAYLWKEAESGIYFSEIGYYAENEKHEYDVDNLNRISKKLKRILSLSFELRKNALIYLIKGQVSMLSKDSRVLDSNMLEKTFAIWKSNK